MCSINTDSRRAAVSACITRPGPSPAPGDSQRPRGTLHSRPRMARASIERGTAILQTGPTNGAGGGCKERDICNGGTAAAWRPAQRPLAVTCSTGAGTERRRFFYFQAKAKAGAQQVASPFAASMFGVAVSEVCVGRIPKRGPRGAACCSRTSDFAAISDTREARFATEELGHTLSVLELGQRYQYRYCGGGRANPQEASPFSQDACHTGKCYAGSGPHSPRFDSGFRHSASQQQ